MSFSTVILSAVSFVLMFSNSVMSQTVEQQIEKFSIPVNPFADMARGPYKTGTFGELWIDQKREDIFTTDRQKRHLMVQVWYPAEFKGSPPRAPYELIPQLYDHKEWMDDWQEIRTNSVLNADVAVSKTPFPVLLYSPGGGKAHFTGTSQTEFLASHGYVVVAVSHSEWTGIKRFPDGSTYKKDAKRASRSPSMSDSEWDRLSISEQQRLKTERRKEMTQMDVDDYTFILDRLKTLNERKGEAFYQRLDMDHAGALGWSAGGVVALVASRDEPRIKAAINFDGGIQADIIDTGTRRPVMIMKSDKLAKALSSSSISPRKREKRLYKSSVDWRMFSASKGDWYHLTLKKAGHGSFADHRLFYAPYPDAIPARLAHEIINRHTLEFFDKYLRGSKHTPLLSGEEAYPQAILFTNKEVQVE